MKDRSKQLFNTKPDLRIYQNEYVRKLLGFNDGIPFGFRDMGVNLDLIKKEASLTKTIDFIYPGSVKPYSYFRKLLEKFASEELRHRTLLVISDLDPGKQAEWATYPNIRFKKLMPNSEVMELISCSRFGINFRPPVSPFNFQTSTKLLEFAACRVPVVSTPSSWLQQFQLAHGGSYFILSPDLGNLTDANLEEFQFEFPDLESYSWENQIIRSGICEFLRIPIY